MSEHLSLATLEVLAHAENLEMLNQYIAIEVQLPDDISTLNNLPDDWQRDPPPDSTCQLGYEWLSKGLALVLEVPGVLVPNEHNYLINPNHKAFKDVTVSDPIPLP